MLLGGLWHGAAWNFVFWGIYHGLGLGLHALYQRLCQRVAWLNHFPRLTGVLSWGITLVFVCYSWLLFFYPWTEVVRLTKSLFIF